MPGDEIRTLCEFNSMSKTVITPFGPSTASSEMCYAFFRFYPYVYQPNSPLELAGHDCMRPEDRRIIVN